MNAETRPFRLVVPGADLRGDIWIPDEIATDAAIVVCHGFKGFKDWGFFPYLTEQLALRTSLPAVCFSFEGSGVRERDFDDLTAFSTNTFTRELFDLEAVLDGLCVGRLGETDVPAVTRFGLLGHSRGGATVILKAATRRQVEAVSTWAAISSVDRYQAFRSAWDRGETPVIPNMRTGQDMPLERNVLDDMLANGPRLDVLAAAAALEVPTAIVHGDEDESVPFADAEALAGAAADFATLTKIEGGSHGFGAVHPFAGSNPGFERAIEASVEAFRKGLTRADEERTT
ncbi:MAG: alpha/beta hydrolase [Gemmatimonadota bacterium]|nr:alpha/beta hydrolase [Gemmatimonadota bacterium]